MTGAAGRHGDRSEAVAAGAQAHPVKPAEVGMLVETVRRILDGG